MNAIQTGDLVPSFNLKDQNGNDFDISALLGRKKLVIFFYPVLIGISGQSVESHKEFAEKNRLKYTLLSDPGNIVRKLFGVPGIVFGLIPGRVTYVADRSGKVVYIFNSQTETQRHADEALKICLLLKRNERVNI